jgi:hypothetical protein
MKRRLLLLALAARALLACALYLAFAFSFSAWALAQCHDTLTFALTLAGLPLALFYPFAILPLHCACSFFDALLAR